MLKKIVLGFFLYCAVSLVYADEKDPASVRIFEVQMKLAQGLDPAAQYHVGEMYEKGLGTDQDLELAHAWYTKAAAQGYALAKDKLANWDRIKQDIAKAKDDTVRAKQIAVGAAKAEQRAAEARAKQQAQEKERATAEARAKQQAQEKERAAAEARAKQQAQEKERAAAEARAKQQAHEIERAAHAAKASTATPAAPPPQAPAKTPSPTEDKGDAAFSANPCKGPSAKFLSTCK